MSLKDLRRFCQERNLDGINSKSDRNECLTAIFQMEANKTSSKPARRCRSLPSFGYNLFSNFYVMILNK